VKTCIYLIAWRRDRLNQLARVLPRDLECLTLESFLARLSWAQMGKRRNEPAICAGSNTKPIDFLSYFEWLETRVRIVSKCVQSSPDLPFVSDRPMVCRLAHRDLDGCFESLGLPRLQHHRRANGNGLVDGIVLNVHRILALTTLQLPVLLRMYIHEDSGGLHLFSHGDYRDFDRQRVPCPKWLMRIFDAHFRGAARHGGSDRFHLV